MLQVWFGAAKPNILYYPDDWFGAHGYKYLGTDFSLGLLRDIEKCKYISDRVVDSKILGVIDSKKISTGVKALLQLKYSDYPVDANWLGDNLMPYIREIGLEKNIVIIAGFLFPIYSDVATYNIKVLNTGRVVSNPSDFYDEYKLAIPVKGDYDNYQLYPR